jgi:hypothetical protein
MDTTQRHGSSPDLIAQLPGRVIRLGALLLNVVVWLAVLGGYVTVSRFH